MLHRATAAQHPFSARCHGFAINGGRRYSDPQRRKHVRCMLVCCNASAVYSLPVEQVILKRKSAGRGAACARVMSGEGERADEFKLACGVKQRTNVAERGAASQAARRCCGEGVGGGWPRSFTARDRLA